MPIIEKVKIMISSMFDSKGADRARASMQRLQQQQKTFSKISERTGFSTGRVAAGMNKLGLRTVGTGAVFDESSKRFIGFNTVAQRVKGTSLSLGQRMGGMATVMRNKALPALMGLGGGLKAVGAKLAPVVSLIGGAVKGMYNWIKGLARFRPEWLSVMFISMFFQKILNGMIQPVAELIGFFEIWKTTLTVLLTPVLLMLLPYLLKFMKYILNLPEPIKKLIGAFILAGSAIMTILFTASQFIIMLSSLGFGIGLLLVLMTPFVGIFTAAASAVLAFINKKEDLNKYLDIFDNLIKKAVDFATDFIGKMGKKFEENLPLIRKIASRIMNTLLDAMEDLIDLLEPWIIIFLDEIMAFFEKHWDRFMEIAQKMVNLLIRALITFIPVLVGVGLTIITAIAKGITENKELIRSSIKKIISQIVKFVEENTGLFIRAGWDIGVAIAGGLADAIRENPVLSFLYEFVRKTGKFYPGSIGGALPYLGQEQYGGHIPQTGMYMLHQGETVSPAGGAGGGSPTIIVNASISSDYDVHRLATELSRYWVADYNRLNQRRGIS